MLGMTLVRAPRFLAALSAIVLTAGLAGCSDDGDENAAASECSYESAGEGSRDVEAPPTEPAYSGQVEVSIATSAGDLGATLDADRAPCTVNSFLSLAEQGYFDDTECHRLTTEQAGIRVLQCGDPTATGTGGPGYSFADELSGDESYTEATIAMANSGPDTNGSQFFLVYADSTNLDQMPNYTIFGTLDDAAVQTLADIAADGTQDGGPDGAPATPVTITGVTAS